MLAAAMFHLAIGEDSGAEIGGWVSGLDCHYLYGAMSIKEVSPGIPDWHHINHFVWHPDV
jgi:hypothetical protein